MIEKEREEGRVCLGEILGCKVRKETLVHFLGCYFLFGVWRKKKIPGSYTLSGVIHAAYVFLLLLLLCVLCFLLLSCLCFVFTLTEKMNKKLRQLHFSNIQSFRWRCYLLRLQTGKRRKAAAPATAAAASSSSSTVAERGLEKKELPLWLSLYFGTFRRLPLLMFLSLWWCFRSYVLLKLLLCSLFLSHSLSFLCFI